MRQDQNNVYIDFWNEVFQYDKIEYALYNLSEELEIKITTDANQLANNRVNGKVLEIKESGPIGEGHETSYQVLPWVWKNIDAVSNIINNSGTFILKSLQKYEIDLNPNWKHINSPWLEQVTKIKNMVTEAMSNAFTNTAQNLVNKYQIAYNEELSKDYGLNFGIISNSLTAHLLYAAQATSKELRDKERASQFASEVTGNPMEHLLLSQFNVLYPLYIETIEPALLKLLSEYYSYIVSLFATELNYSYENITKIFNVSSSNELLTSSSSNVKESIIQALKIYPSNGNVIGYAIIYNILDDELCNYGKFASKKFNVLVRKWAISKLKEIYNNGKLFNKPIVNDDNEFIIKGLIRYYAFKDGDVSSNNSDWQTILSAVFAEIINKTKDTFSLLAQGINNNESNKYIDNRAKNNNTVKFSSNDLEMFITCCNELHETGCVKIAEKLKYLFPVTTEQITNTIEFINHSIKIKYEEFCHKQEAEQIKRAKEEAEAAERAAECKKKKVEQIARITKCVRIVIIAIVSIAIITMLAFFSIKLIHYNNAINLQKQGKHIDAINAFTELGGFLSSKDKISETYFLMGDVELNNKNYLKAIENYNKATNVDGVTERINEANYMLGKQHFNSEDYNKAYEVFEALGTYKDSANLLKQSAENSAKVAMSSRDYKSAISWYEILGNISEVKNAKYLYITSHLDSNDENTFSYLEDLKSISYKDSESIYNNLYQIRFEFVVNESPTDYTTNMSSFKYHPSEHLGGYIYVHYRVLGGTPGQTMYVNYDGWQTGSGTVKCNGSWNTLTDGRFLAYGSSSSNTTLEFSSGISSYSKEILGKKTITVYK